jgi:rhodanese-related sulfurtransferase
MTPKYVRANLGFGFGILFLSGCFGAFLATDLDRAFLVQEGSSQLTSWAFTLAKSSHGHLSLFGLIHILLGLSLPFVPRTSEKSQKWLTSAIGAGSFSMGVLLFIKSWMTPHTPWANLLGLALGLGLGASLLGLFFHSLSFFKKEIFLMKTLSPKEAFESLTLNSQIKLFDVREPDEHGVISFEKATLTPLSTLDPKSIESRYHLKKTDPLYFICRSGGRSERAALLFLSEGFNDVTNVSGGMIAWEKSGLPCTRGA